MKLLSKLKFGGKKNQQNNEFHAAGNGVANVSTFNTQYYLPTYFVQANHINADTEVILPRLCTSKEMADLINLDMQAIAQEINKAMRFQYQKQKGQKSKDVGGTEEDAMMYVEETLNIIIQNEELMVLTKLKVL